MTTFADLGLSPKILTALEKTTLKTPTPIQAAAPTMTQKAAIRWNFGMICTTRGNC